MGRLPGEPPSGGRCGTGLASDGTSGTGERAQAQEMGLPVNFHIASGDISDLGKDANPQNGASANYAMLGVSFFLGNAGTIAKLTCGGVCHLLTTWPEDDPPIPGDVLAYRCADCLDRWDIVVPEPD